jgi:hypothetical protein
MKRSAREEEGPALRKQSEHPVDIPGNVVLAIEESQVNFRSIASELPYYGRRAADRNSIEEPSP